MRNNQRQAWRLRRTPLDVLNCKTSHQNSITLTMHSICVELLVHLCRLLNEHEPFSGILAYNATTGLTRTAAKDTRGGVFSWFTFLNSAACSVSKLVEIGTLLLNWFIFMQINILYCTRHRVCTATRDKHSITKHVSTKLVTIVCERVCGQIPVKFFSAELLTKTDRPNIKLRFISEFIALLVLRVETGIVRSLWNSMHQPFCLFIKLDCTKHLVNHLSWFRWRRAELSPSAPCRVCFLQLGFLGLAALLCSLEMEAPVSSAGAVYCL